MGTPPAHTGQWLETDGARWFFDSGSAALDFGYAPDISRLLSRDLGERELHDALTLRAAVLRGFEAAADHDDLDPDDVDTINLFASTPDVPPVLAGGRRQAGRTSPRAAQKMSSLARDAVAILGGDRDRIRRCAAEDCGLVFYDTSRAGTRRWCSMQRCGNRAKVRAHRARPAAE